MTLTVRKTGCSPGYPVVRLRLRPLCGEYRLKTGDRSVRGVPARIRVTERGRPDREGPLPGRRAGRSRLTRPRISSRLDESR
jgi:hypothetical protein